MKPMCPIQSPSKNIENESKGEKKIRYQSHKSNAVLPAKPSHAVMLIHQWIHTGISTVEFDEQTGDIGLWECGAGRGW